MKDCVIHLGEKFKLNVGLDPMGSLTMDDYDFVVEAYCVSYRRQIIPKAECLRDDANNYVARVDSNILGPGKVRLDVKAKIPDRDFEDGFRPDICKIETRYTIVK